jgi:hypothetical protein
MADNDMISFSSIYGFESREPMIHFEWGSMKGELSVIEARAHAIAVLETVEAAIGDAFFFEFGAKVNPEDPERAGAALIKEFREWRHERGFGGGIDPSDHRPYPDGPNRAERRRKK